MGFFTIFVTIAFYEIRYISAEAEYQAVARELHNQYRNIHHVEPLSNSEDLNSRAVTCAQYYADNNVINHSCSETNDAGENIWIQWGGSPSDVDAAVRSTDKWYSEKSKYDYNKDLQPDAGHFTQLVWKSSREFGFGVGRSGDRTVGVGLYNPRENVMGDFKNNVFPP